MVNKMSKLKNFIFFQEDLENLERVKKKYRLTKDTQAVRFALAAAVRA
jgi:hypothetical protein